LNIRDVHTYTDDDTSSIVTKV